VRSRGNSDISGHLGLNYNIPPSVIRIAWDTLGGYTLAARNEEGRDRRADQREARARRAALAERLEEERHNFQRDTFLELQDVLLELTRWQALVISQDLKTLKAQLPDELGGNDMRLLVATARKLWTRVLDPGHRAEIGTLSLSAPTTQAT